MFARYEIFAVLENGFLHVRYETLPGLEEKEEKRALDCQGL